MDNNLPNVADSSPSFEELTNRLKVGDSITLMQRETELLDTAGDTARVKTYAFAKTGWRHRVLRWFGIGR